LPSLFNPSGKLFEIYPFLGINPVNYSYGQIERLFEKYFTGFKHDTPASRKTNLFEWMGKRHLDITTISGKMGSADSAGKRDCNYMFAGIKLYPPLGFNPWPDDEKELAKVRLIYDQCLEKNIPITTHCSDGGYLTDPLGKDFSNPGMNWKKVLSYPGYQNLKIDFAHFGHQQSGATDWKQSILGYFATNPNVYSDISCCGLSDGFYESFKTYLNPSDVNRFLFGSDFLINLLWIDSYNEYLDLFLSDQNLDAQTKLQLCNLNAERFLFG